MKKKPWQQLDKYYNDLVGNEFLMKARYFRKVQIETPEQFESLAKHCEVDRRTAFYWAEIGRVFGELDVDQKRSARLDGRNHVRTLVSQSEKIGSEHGATGAVARTNGQPLSEEQAHQLSATLATARRAGNPASRHWRHWSRSCGRLGRKPSHRWYTTPTSS